MSSPPTGSPDDPTGTSDGSAGGPSGSGDDGRPWPTRHEHLVLHAVRLAGFADAQTVATRAELPLRTVSEVLDDLHRGGSVERFAFADSGGWILTDAGKARDAAWLAEELETSGLQPLLAGTTERFETVNGRLVQVVTAWQLRTPVCDDDRTDDPLGELARIATALDELMAVLAYRLPRFARYPRQFRAALELARAGDLDWVAGVGRLSCHTVWAELHEDLLSSLGRDRSAGAPRG